MGTLTERRHSSKLSFSFLFNELYLIDTQTSKIVYVFNFGSNKIVSTVQDEGTGDVYLKSDGGFSYIFRYTEGDEPEIDITEDTYHFSSHKNAILSRGDGDGVYYNEQKLTDDTSDVVCTFASRNVIGFINENNTLFLIDKKY